MKLILKYFVIFISITVFAAENCDKFGILLYEDLGCTPHYDDPKSCPTKYDCPHLQPWTNECYFRGKTYQNGEEVDENLLVPPCERTCLCSNFSGKTQFTCAVLDCPEWLEASITPPGCYKEYSFKSCCSLGRAGENVQNSCAPLYNKKSENEVHCCPFDDWICPDGTEEIKGEAKKDDTCKFGDKTLKVGQKFEKLNFVNSYGRKFRKLACECIIPPLLTCSREL